MKKIIACMLTLCMAAAMFVYDGSLGVHYAAAEAAETATTPAAETTAEPAAPQTGETTEQVPAPAEQQAAATQAPEVTEVPEAAETPEVTAEPAASEQMETGAEVEATEQPETTDDLGATTQPDSAAVEPDATVEPTATPEPAAAEANVGSGPVWITEGAHRRYGELDELLPTAAINQLTIYLCTTSVLELSGYTTAALSNVGFGLDVDALGEDYCDGKSVIISAISKSGDMQKNTLYIWVGRASDIPTPAEGLGANIQVSTDEDDILETEIMVQPSDYTADAPCMPAFTLTAYPSLIDGMTFAVIFNGGDPAAISGSEYVPMTSGTYRFAVLDAEGTLTARSMPFEVEYGTTEPTTTTEPEVTAEPETTDEPEASAEPKATDIPEITAEPETTDEPEATAEPETTDEPEATAEPEASTEPETTDEPEASAEPKATDIPEITAEPETTDEPEATAEPETTDEPEASAEPETTDEPKVTGEPEASEEPEASTELETTDVPEFTEEPEPTATPTGNVLTEDDLAEDAAPAPVVVETPELTVRAYDYAEDAISNLTPVFELSGVPIGSGYAYGVAVNGGLITTLVGNTFCFTDDGEYSFVFYLLDAEGKPADTSKIYHTTLDFSQTAENSEAWMMIGNDKVYGSLETLLNQAEDGATVYLLTTDVIALGDASRLNNVTLKPDENIFGADRCVMISMNDPDGE